MSSLISVQTLIEYIEALPAQEQTLLFDELFRRNIIKQRQENIDSTVKVAVDSAIGLAIEKLSQEIWQVPRNNRKLKKFTPR